MPRFDYLTIDKKWLPKEMRKKDMESGWCTRSLSCDMVSFAIKKTGELACIYNEEGYCYDPLDYTGEIEFWRGIDKSHSMFKAWCFQGVVKFVVQLEPEVREL